MNTLTHSDDPLYERARQILMANPGIGKNRLGAMLGIKAPSSRLRIVRYRGETEGHSTHPDFRNGESRLNKPKQARSLLEMARSAVVAN